MSKHSKYYTIGWEIIISLFCLLTNFVFAQENLIMNGGLETKLNFRGKSYFHDNGNTQVIEHNDTFLFHGFIKKDMARVIAKDWDYIDSSYHRMEGNALYSDAGRAHSGNVFKILHIEDIHRLNSRYFLNTAIGKLCKPLTEGNQYLVSFYLKPFTGNHFTKNICAAFFIDSISQETMNSNSKRYSYFRHIESPDWCMDEISRDTTQYTKYEFLYTASGGEKYLHIGNIKQYDENYSDKKTFKSSFHKTKQYGYWKNRQNKFMCQYALDDVSVFPVSNKNEVCKTDDLLSENMARERNDTILLATLLFDYDKSVNSEKLDSLINNIYYAANIEKIIITGHTDKEGIEEYNKQLSLKRAAFIREELMLFTSLPIEVIGYGYTQPLSDTDSRLNRRAEVFAIIRE